MIKTSEITAEHIFGGLTRPQKLSARTEDFQILNTAMKHSVDHNGLELVVWSWGEGKSVLLMHGWESRASHLAAFVQPLLDEGYRVIALDAPAHGDSSGHTTDVLDFGRALVNVAAYFGPMTAVIAHSMGSAASLYAFSQGVDVKASIHISGPASLTRLIQHFAKKASLNSQEVIRLEEMMVEHLVAPLSVMDLSSLGEGMKHPALILHDPEDREIPFSESEELRQVWPAAILEAVHGVGHRRILQSPSVVAAAINFIKQSCGSGGGTDRLTR